MTILQWNNSGYYNNLEELQILIKQKSPSIIYLQENHFLSEHQPRLRNFTIYSQDCNTELIALGGMTTFIQDNF